MLALQQRESEETPVPTSMAAERERYREMWGHTAYRRYAPGEHHIDEALEAFKPRLGASFIDFGCGTGRPAAELRQRGYGVLAIDFAENCLDEGIDVPLLVADLTELPQVKAEYGYCTDVMEHIPTERVDDVLSGIARSVRKGAFLSISLVPDAFGPAVLGSHLHLTVRNGKWWIERLRQHWPYVEVISDDKSQLLVACTNPGLRTGEDAVKTGTNTPEKEILEQIRINDARPNIKYLMACKEHEHHAVMVGGGPSLVRHLSEIKTRQEHGQHIFALNGAAKFLKEHGITPEYMVMIDARPHNIKFLEGWPAKAYIIASQCHPSVLDALEAQDVMMFHQIIEGLDEYLTNGKPATRVYGTYTVGLTAMSVAVTAGYRELHLYGYDSSDAETGNGHAYKQQLTDAESKRVKTVFDGREYSSSYAMFKQAEQFEEFARMLADFGATITVHGTGLLPDIARKMTQTPGE